MNPLPLLFRHRSSLVLPLVTPLLIWGLGAATPTWAESLAGVGLVALGAGLRLASARCLGRGARVHRADARGGLVSWGPYAWSRNPLYVAAALVLTGFGLVTGGGPWAWLLLPATALVYTPVVVHEERAIRAAVGEPFEAYRRRVWRWIGPRGGDPAPAGELVAWTQVLRRERLLVPGLALGLAGVACVHGGQLPLRALARVLSRASGLPVLWLCGAGLATGALINSVGIERKWARHEARRAAAADEHGSPPVNTAVGS